MIRYLTDLGRMSTSGQVFPKGLSVSDEIKDTLAEATRGFFGAVGFILLLLGAEMMAERGDIRFGLGIVLTGLGVLCFYAAVIKKHAQKVLSNPQIAEVNLIATSPRWWLGILAVFCLILVLSPYIEQGGWPFADLGPVWVWLILMGIGLLITMTAMIVSLYQRKESASTQGDNHRRMFAIKSGLYVGRVSVRTDKLDTDLFMEIGIVTYNGTGKFVSIDSINGFILYDGGTRLPKPVIIGEKSNTQNLPAAKEFLIVLEQRVPKNVAEHVLKTITEGKTAIFNLSSLNISVIFPPSSEFPARLPLWDGFTLSQRAQPFVGQLVSLTATATI